MNAISNEPEAFTIAKRAMKDAADGKKNELSAEARMTYAIFRAYNEEIEFLAVIPSGDAATREPAKPFTLADMLPSAPKPQREGKDDNVLIGARKLSLAQTMFGMTDVTPAWQQMLSRALPIAEHIDATIAKLKDDDAAAAMKALALGEYVDTSFSHARKVVCVTAPLCLFLPPDLKTLTYLTQEQREIIHQLRFMPYKIDGKALTLPTGQRLKIGEVNVSASLSRLRDANEERLARGRYAPDYAAKQAKAAFNGAIETLNSYAVTVLTTDEAPRNLPALTKTDRLNLFVMSQRIASLFAADPLSEEERELLNAREAADKIAADNANKNKQQVA